MNALVCWLVAHPWQATAYLTIIGAHVGMIRALRQPPEHPDLERRLRFEKALTKASR